MKQNVLHVATTNHPLLIHLCVIMFGLVAVVSLGWLCFIVSRPDQWKEMVDRENDFWVGKGMGSAAVAERFRRFEKGPGQKILAALLALIGVFAFIWAALALKHK